MKNLRNWSMAIAVTIFVAGVATLGAQSTGWLSLLIEESSGAVQSRGLGRYGAPVLVGRGTAAPTVANSGAPPQDGELYIVTAASTEPDLQFYSANSSAWNSVAGVDVAQTWTASPTFGGGATLGSDEDDTITFNSPITYEVMREDFDFPPTATANITGGTFVVAALDTNENILLFQNIPMYWRYEIGFGGSYTPATFLNGGVFSIDDATILDNTDNDGIEFTLFGSPVDSVVFDEDSTETAYCEISVTIADISDVSAEDFYFGFFLAAAVDDAFGYTGANTMAYFQISDTSGDLDIETELNGGGTLNDDTGTEWADTETHVLRVEISADAVAFYVDGTAVTQTNAVLNADDSDVFVCRLGLRSAGTSIAGVDLNYIEVGRAQ